MAELKKQLDEGDLDELMLGTPEARIAYQEQSLALAMGRMIRRERQLASLTQTELAAMAGINQGDLSRLETGQGVRGATIGFVERVAHAMGLDVIIKFVDPAKKGGGQARSKSSKTRKSILP